VASFLFIHESRVTHNNRSLLAASLRSLLRCLENPKTIGMSDKEGGGTMARRGYARMANTARSRQLQAMLVETAGVRHSKNEKASVMLKEKNIK